MTVFRERPVSPIESVLQDRDDREQIERISPPDTLHGKAINVRALNLSSIGEQKPHVFREPEGVYL